MVMLRMVVIIFIFFMLKFWDFMSQKIGFHVPKNRISCPKKQDFIPLKYPMLSVLLLGSQA